MHTSSLFRFGVLGGLQLSWFLAAGLSFPSYAQDLSVAAKSPGIEQPSGVSLRRDVQPIFDAQCVQCHMVDAMWGWLDLEPRYAYDMLVNASGSKSRFPRVVPGKPEESSLMHALEDSPGNVVAPMPPVAMPPWTPMDRRLLDPIRKWIAEGAKNN